MNIEDLRKLVHLTQTQNVHLTAFAFNVTTGALSKTLKKIENHLNTPLFDRVGRHLRLNANGHKFSLHANDIINRYDVMLSEYISRDAKHWLTIAGPAVLLDHYLADILPHLANKHIEVNLETVFEGEAISRLKKGQIQLAVVTDAAISDWQAMGLNVITLGVTTFKLVAATAHGINNVSAPTLATALEAKFVCPSSSPFCGITRGIGSDGWPDHRYPRNIAFRCDSFASLISLLKKEPLLAYIPDIALDPQLSVIELADFSPHNQEVINLVYKPSIAPGWLLELVDKINALQMQS
ncbi:hypothetical protein PULV_a3077 [Pseudoalteromonas ulvae UL12]|uniref:HTH lysR-type domain-containing protein n=1 Tax=Pseudoalteromonas ulvae TaxID=107327 RepID=A0A244CVB4_PSEDV|nr:LysR family transcriptional regulator [Pseudoalteromonas ulvae]MBE0362442.1 hypothetical protein [Pseudoalteromonas ulvae UL12]OUL59573.1 hypothetical protein B1199_04845 [Pseudoalteromonas ulvae]